MMIFDIKLKSMDIFAYISTEFASVLISYVHVQVWIYSFECVQVSSLIEKSKLNRNVFINVINYKNPPFKYETFSSHERRT